MAEPTRREQVLQIIETVSAEPIQPNQVIMVLPGSGLNPPVANDLLFGTTSGPITPQNVNTAQAFSATIVSVESGFSGNIPGSFGGSIMSSGYWTLTAIISMGQRSKSSRVVWNGGTNSTLEFAVAKAKEWGNELTYLLGNTGGVSTPSVVVSAASPRLVAFRVTDAKLPRIGQLVTTDPAATAYSGNGSATQDARSADFASTALSSRMLGVVSPTVQSYANHSFYGVPDYCVKLGDVLELGPAAAGEPNMSTSFARYFNYIFDANNKLGFMMQDPSETKFEVGPFTYVGARWQVTLAGTGYANKDRVRITAANNNAFNGSYKVSLDLTNTIISFNNGPPSGVLAATLATMQRYQLASGERKNVWAQFVRMAGQYASPFNLRVAKRNPGRSWSAVSFSKKKKKVR